MAFIDRLKEARLRKGFTQEQLAEKIGVAKSTYTGYEKGNREPNVNTIGKLMETLEIDANFLWQDETTFPFELTYDEMENLVKKYRELDSFGKNNVNQLLENEYSRCKTEAFWEKTQPTLFDLFPPDITIHDDSSSANDTLVEISQPIDRIEFMKKMMDFFEQNPFPNAAHARTDIKPTADDVKHDEDIMDDDNF